MSRQDNIYPSEVRSLQTYGFYHDFVALVQLYPIIRGQTYHPARIYTRILLTHEQKQHGTREPIDSHQKNPKQTKKKRKTNTPTSILQKNTKQTPKHFPPAPNDLNLTFLWKTNFQRNGPSTFPTFPSTLSLLEKKSTNSLSHSSRTTFFSKKKHLLKPFEETQGPALEEDHSAPRGVQQKEKVVVGFGFVTWVIFGGDFLWIFLGSLVLWW